MDIIRWSISRPVSITVGVLLTVLFGLIALGTIPIQLTPTVDRPVVTVSTSWPGRSPQEIVDEITREQEKRLKNVSNLKRMYSASREGSATVTLEFYVGSDITRALQEVSDGLRQVPEYPEDVDEPVIQAAEGAAENAIAWVIFDIRPEGRERLADFDITTIYDALDREVKPYIERIDGVAAVNIYGGREREVRVLLDPVALAQRELSHTDVIGALRAENRNVSAGTIAEGKHDYRVRVIGQFADPDDVLATVVAWRDGRPVFVRDVARVEFSHQKARGFVRSLGVQCLAMNIIRQSNANVVSVMADVRKRLAEVQAEVLPKISPVAGADLRLRQVYDETVYIDSAIDLVLDNLWQGGVLAAVVLLLFLRSVTATGIIGMAIPISVIGTFLVMAAFGRTLNVVSLAGLAFATGMVVDNGIVVLENTYRRLQMGDTPSAAAYRGGREVWGAVLASTLTTVAVFIPIITVREEVGQLFRDISLAIAVAVSISLIVSITVVPTAAAHFIGKAPSVAPRDSALMRGLMGLFGLAALLAAGVRALGSGLLWLMTGWRAWSLRPAVIVLMAGASVWAGLRMVPPMDYLPQGNRNLVFGGLLIPPGYSIEQNTKIAERIEAHLKPYVEADIDDAASVGALPPIPRMGPPGPDGKPRMYDPVPVDNFFIGSFGGGMFIGATSQDDRRVIPVGALLTNAMISIPAAFGGAQQSSVFGRGLGGGNSVNVEIMGPRLDRVAAAAARMSGLGYADPDYGYGRVRPDPANFNLPQPEVRLRLNWHGRELGLTTRDVGVAVRGLFDGAFVDDFILAGDAVDMIVLPAEGRLDYKEQLDAVPVSTSAGPVPLDEVVDWVQTLAPQEIQRVEELPAVTIRFTPPPGRAVEQVLSDVRERFLAPVERAGLIDPTMRVRMEGTAAKLDEVKTALFGARAPSEKAPWQRVIVMGCWLLGAGGLAVGLYAFAKAFVRGRGALAYGGAGAILVALVVAGLLGGLASQPQLATARFIWALAVTYLLMCALFESFTYPFVIMFSVPLAVVGGFAGLYIVHRATLADPTIAPQNFDTLTMLGFVILIGTVVNNAILLVEQALNFMDPARFGAGDEPLPPLTAIAESVRSRVRPIFMTTLTTVGGMLPLVIAPGAGSEMYRGLGAVVLGGLVVSTVFTLVLVPLVFSLTLEMRDGLRALFGARPVEARSVVVTEPALAAPIEPKAGPRELEPV